MQQDFRQLLEKYLNYKKRGIRDSHAERDLIDRHRLFFRKYVGEKRPIKLLGWEYPTKDWSFWQHVENEAAETFVSFDSEDVIFQTCS